MTDTPRAAGLGGEAGGNGAGPGGQPWAHRAGGACRPLPRPPARPSESASVVCRAVPSLRCVLALLLQTPWPLVAPRFTPPQRPQSESWGGVPEAAPRRRPLAPSAVPEPGALFFLLVALRKGLVSAQARPGPQQASTPGAWHPVRLRQARHAGEACRSRQARSPGPRPSTPHPPSCPQGGPGKRLH